MRGGEQSSGPLRRAPREQRGAAPVPQMLATLCTASADEEAKADGGNDGDRSREDHLL